MVHKERPYDSSERSDSYKFPYGGTRHNPPIEVNPDEVDQDEIKTVKHYFLHHIQSDRVPMGRETVSLFD